MLVSCWQRGCPLANTSWSGGPAAGGSACTGFFDRVRDGPSPLPLTDRCGSGREHCPAGTDAVVPDPASWNGLDGLLPGQPAGSERATCRTSPDFQRSREAAQGAPVGRRARDLADRRRGPGDASQPAHHRRQARPVQRRRHRRTGSRAVAAAPRHRGRDPRAGADGRAHPARRATRSPELARAAAAAADARPVRRRSGQWPLLEQGTVRAPPSCTGGSLVEFARARGGEGTGPRRAPSEAGRSGQR